MIFKLFIQILLYNNYIQQKKMAGGLLSLLIIATCGLSVALKADIRADSNRDGIVDIHGRSDLPDKLSDSNDAGAIFLANIGDTDRRCSKLALSGPALSNEELAACNDASDDIQRAPQYLAPLRTVPIPKPNPKASGTITIQDPNSRSKVRIFRLEGSQWITTGNEHVFSQHELAAGLKLGIDARDTRRPGVWDGRVAVTFTVHDGRSTAKDTVSLRVAPVLTHHHAQAAREVFTTAGNYSEGANFFQGWFVDRLQNALDKTRGRYPLTQFHGSDDIWAQDFVEPGYTSMPGPNGPIVLHIMIRSAQDERVAGRQVFEYLRKSGVGAVQHLGGERNDINAMGNLETIPPYEFRGKRYRAGRIIMGAHNTTTPFIMDYLRAQQVQDPLLLDTDCLAIGHVDEIVQFLPVNSRRGWVMLVADPISGVEMLQNAVKHGHGDTRAFSRENDTVGNPTDLFMIPGGLHGVPDDSISEVLAWDGILKANTAIAACMQRNIRILKAETGITDAEIIRMPVMFRTGLAFAPDNGIGPERNASTTLGVSLYPNPINGLALNHGDILAPTPWGPVIDGVDILASAVQTIYRKLGYQVSFVDNWNSHHTWGGEVHCGTNVVRDGKRWW
ncbi:hypothetical protein VE01_07200 [Pseudogymnoascus verrucosus]|uniref:Protein-arginine deiminase C-terminal domain-containing protein n=1 Tax=Pseudogymnoascus verrucosus TaxID=342668 RepID=A0A1B8GF81_9PEZI|nr:uncharacterized protein VE01_07200 [Pseudogymnoascus verrucosus]OBT94486.2 hypothetical protein VE01_07200 [Pseudogymnoascus verrucosus]